MAVNVSSNVTAIASFLKWILSLAALVGAIETIIKLARVAWALILRVFRSLPRRSAFAFARI